MQRRQQRNAKPGNSKHVPKANQNSDMRASLKRKAKRGTTEPRPGYSEGSEADHRKPPPPPLQPRKQSSGGTAQLATKQEAPARATEIAGARGGFSASGKRSGDAREAAEDALRKAGGGQREIRDA